MTAVIVRSAANINAGGYTKVACFVHGLLLVVSILLLAPQLNRIPKDGLLQELLRLEPDVQLDPLYAYDLE